MIKLRTAPVSVRWGDMDSMGHVNNTLYFRFCEQIRMEWFAGLDLSQDEHPDSLIVIINAFCEFLLPIRYPSTLVVDMYGSDPGKTSFMSHYTIKEQGDSTVHYANGTAKVVWVDHTGTKSVPLPSSVVKMLGSQ